MWIYALIHLSEVTEFSLSKLLTKLDISHEEVRP